jgi:hypothetical protein
MPTTIATACRKHGQDVDQSRREWGTQRRSPEIADKIRSPIDQA